MSKCMAEIFTAEWAAQTFPASRTDAFFDALFGGAEEGAYDIDLSFEKDHGACLEFVFNLRQRPGKCLVCNLTYGLPQVFTRHPVINAKGVAEQVGQTLGKPVQKWELKQTREVSSAHHHIPFFIYF